MEAFASSPCFHNVGITLAPNIFFLGGYSMAKKIVTDLSVKGKKVLVRVDFNVPLKDGVITDDNRIVQALPTIQYLIDNHAKVILFSHLGKVKSEEDKARLSLRPVAERLSELLKKEETLVPETRGEAL